MEGHGLPRVPAKRLPRERNRHSRTARHQRRDPRSGRPARVNAGVIRPGSRLKAGMVLSGRTAGEKCLPNGTTTIDEVGTRTTASEHPPRLRRTPPARAVGRWPPAPRGRSSPLPGTPRTQTSRSEALGRTGAKAYPPSRTLNRQQWASRDLSSTAAGCSHLEIWAAPARRRRLARRELLRGRSVNSSRDFLRRSTRRPG